MQDVYGLKAAAIAVYPMYKGLARLVGMDILDPGQTARRRRSTRFSKVWNDYDFFFLHYKYTDSTGEDGNFPAKVQMIEKLDADVPDILALKPDVLIVTGDHSTPSKMKIHSWHPVPTLILADTCRTDDVKRVRRVVVSARRPRPVPGQAPDVAGDGPRRPPRQVWCIGIFFD